MHSYTPSCLLNSQALAVVGTDLTVNGHSPPVDLRYTPDVTLTCVVTASPGGTTPTLDLYLDLFDANGLTISGVLHLTQLTGSVLSAYGSAGLHTAGLVLPEYGQVRWVLGGTTPSFPVSLVLTGR